jgi:beta-lactamase class A
MTAYTDWPALNAAIAEAERAGGIVGIAARGPQGERFARHDARRFRTASTVKVPLMIEFLRGVDRGDFALTALHTLTAADKVPGSGVLLALHEGLSLTYRDLLYLTMTISDNTATNILIERAGMAAVNATMRELGMADSALERKMRGRAAEPGEPENWGTPADYLRAIGAILDGSAASPASNALMRTMLEQQQNPRRIGRYVPTGAGISWGSKTGSLGGVANDVGFIASPRGTLLLAIFTEDLPEAADPERTIGLLARAAMLDTGIAVPLPHQGVSNE